MLSLLNKLASNSVTDICGRGHCRTIISILDLDPRKFGSMEEYLLFLSEALRQNGWQHILIFNNWPDKHLIMQFQEKGALVETSKIDTSIASYIGLVSIIKRYKPQIVHFHFLSPFSMFPVLARFAGSNNVVFTEHMCPPQINSFIRKIKFWIWDRVILQLLGVKIFSVSRYVQSVLLDSYQLSKKRTAILNNGVNIKRFDSKVIIKDDLKQLLEIPKGSTVIVSAAYLIQEKGIDDLLLAAAKVIEVKNDILFVIVGDGPEFNNLTHHAKKLCLEGNTRFVGLRSDVQNFMAMADLVVVPSFCQEAAGLVVIEAMAMGRPVIATRVGGVPEYLEDGVTGLLVEPSNPDQLAAAILKLLNASEMRQVMGANGRRRVEEQFSMEKWVNNTIDAYLRIVDQ
jgi:L-malate glycosyltransferase